MLYRRVFDKISTEFRGILRVFVNFAALRRREIPEALTTSCIIYTNWRLKIYIWRLHFSSWSPKGDLRIFLISSPDIADQDTAQYNLCSAGENCGSWAELLKCTTDNLFSSHVFLLNLLLTYKFTSKTGSFKSYDSHQLLCGGMVEGNSELFCIAWFCRHLYIHPGLFGGLKIVQFDWLLLKLINYSYSYKPIGVPHFGQLDVSWYPMKP